MYIVYTYIQTRYIEIKRLTARRKYRYIRKQMVDLMCVKVAAVFFLHFKWDELRKNKF